MASRSNAAAAAAAATPLVKSPRLATLIEVAASLTWIFATTLYIAASINLLSSLNLATALGIIALVTPFFLVIWRALSFYKNAHAAMGLAGKMTKSMTKKPDEKLSTLV